MKTLRYILTLLVAVTLTATNAWCAITPTTPSQDASGVYQIGTAEELWWFAQNAAASANAKLTDDIDLGGSTNGSFPNFGSSTKRYTGTFDGNGKTIKGYYWAVSSSTSGQGFFNYTAANAVIKDFTLEGEILFDNASVKPAFVGAVVGSATSTTIEDVTSSVNITFTDKCVGTSGSGIRILGGIVGSSIGGTINRCRYNGTMSLNASADAIGDRFAGIVGDVRTNKVTISNCLFDGTIQSEKSTIAIGGILGKTETAVADIKNCLSVGTLDLKNINANHGMVVGMVNNNYKPTVSTTYYTKDKFTVNNTEVGTTGYNTAGTLTDGSDWESLTNTLNNNAVVGETANWKIVEGQDWPIPMEYTIEAAGPYTITFDTKGGTPIDPIVADYGTPITAPADPTKTGYVFAGWDREIPTTMPGANITITALWTYTPVEGYYLISTKEDFFNFATVVSTNASANAKLLEDINLEEETFNGFTGYKGTFDGNKKTISGYKRTFTSGSSSLGFFNTTDGATIKDFTLEGEEIYNINSACYAIGSVIGMSVNTTIDGVTSKVKMTFGANCPSGTGGIRVVGGLVGRITGGSINKCRYKGTIDLSANSGICDRFGGIVGDLGAASTISNCLFDGEIKVAATSSLTMGGILGARNNQTPTISHCLFNGKMTFPTGANISNCGPISGGTGVTASDSYYDMTGFTVGGVKQAKTALQQSSSIERTTQPWLDILVLLNAGSTNWGIETETYPVPGDKAAATYTLSFNTDGGTPAIDSQSLPEGATVSEPSPAPTKTGYTFAGWYNGDTKVTFPMTMPAGNVTLTAHWDIDKYTLTFDVNGGTAIASVTQDYNTTYTLPTAVKAGYRFDGWNSESDGSGTTYLAGANYTITANATLYAQYTFVPNAEGVYEIGNREDYVNFVAVTKTNAAANAKLIDNIDLNNEAVDGIGTNTASYTGTFDGQGFTINNYYRNTTSGSYSGLFAHVTNATIRNFNINGSVTIGGMGQQHGSVIGCSTGTTLVEDVHSSVNVTITSTASQVGGFVGRAGGTYNRCRYDGTVSSSTAYDKIGGFAGNILAGTLTNCLFDGTITLSAENEGLKTAAFVASSFGDNPHVIKNCLVNGTMNISHPNDNCGIVVGYYEQALTVDHTYYTGSGSAITGAKGTLTGRATPVGTLTMDQLLTALNPTEGTDGNWEIKTGTGAKTYPVPSKCTITAHVHSYINGFCIAEDGNYEPAAKAGDGYYEVSNGGQLWWIATNINDGTLAKTTRFRLTADIDLEGDKHGSWPGICTLGKNGNQDDWAGTAFQGIFNGKGYTINNYYQQINAGLARRGLFNAVYNATIKDFNINGSITVSGNGAEAVMIGAAIGGSSGTSTIEDINSSVNITVKDGIVRDLGGVAGGLGDQNNNASVTMNRCRYNGTITLSGTSNKAAQNVGGVVGELRSAVMKNCLYDGTITVGSGVTYTSIGGVVGKVGSYDNSEMHRILCHGVITLPDGYDASTNANKCGVVVGSAEKTIYLYKCFHTTNKGGGEAGSSTSGLPFIGPHIIDKKATVSDEGATVGSIIKVDQLLGTSTDKTSNLSDLYSEAFRTLLGEPNWAAVTEDYTYPLKDTGHIHKYKNGFCTSGDGEYEKPSNIGSKYQIYNAGQLFWFAEHFNAGAIVDTATVEIMRDLDMEYDAYIYPGIGSQARPFKGVFEGHGHKIQRYYRDIVNAEHTGLINDAVGATIQGFSIYGEVNFNLATIKSFHGTVLGFGINESRKDENGNTVLVDTMMITDVFSFVNINCLNANTRVLGGIAGRTSGGVHRSRYSGTIQGMKGAVSTSGRQIAGIVANAREKIFITDCLFDGKIRITCQEADTMRVSGILASNEKNSGVKITIKNCLFNGCLELDHTYKQNVDGTGVKSTQNGIIAGYWDSNLPKFVNNVYYLKTCDGMDDIDIGQWEGKAQQSGSTMDVIAIDTIAGISNPVTPEQWNEIFKLLDEYKEVKNPETNQTDTIRNGNWIYSVDTTSTKVEVIPGGHVCHHLNDDGTSAYDEFGYCTICGHARPLEKDTDGKYKLELVSDLASFRDMVNDGDINESTILNCKLTADIDFATFDGDFGEPIGNSNFNRYLYNFDGQGYSLLNVKITTDDQYVGFFGFAGDDSHDCEIHDLTITGEINVPYKSTDNDDKPMYMGVVGKMYRGKIYNVHSELKMTNTNATRAMIGGIVGCVETLEGNDANGNPLAVIIDKCSYTGDCYANAAGNMGGIVGQASRYTSVTNCTFAGNVHHTYKGVNNQTNFSGIVGYNEEPTFQGVKNCIVAGVLNTDPDRTYSEYGVEGNHKNTLCGEDKIITAITTNQRNDGGYTSRYSGNYAWNVYARLVPTNSIVFPAYVDQSKFINGEICAIMNGRDDDPADIQDGHPWRQILGYQKGSGKGGLGINDDGNIEAGPHTDGSPAMRVPLPGYKLEKIGEDSVKTSYRVIKDADKNYLADFYYLDDAGDATPMPSDAASMRVKRIDYTRKAEYMGGAGGYSSFCLPFDFTEAMLPAGEDSKCFTYYRVANGDEVQFREVKKYPIERGTPFILYSSTSADWTPGISVKEAGTPMALRAGTYDDGAATVTNIPATDGLYGVFNTKLIGSGYWKLKDDGRKLVKTVGETEHAADSSLPLSHCYPYRAYFRLPEISVAPAGAPEKQYKAVFLTDSIEDLPSEPTPDVQHYNPMGQRVNADARGFVIIKGRKTLVR